MRLSGYMDFNWETILSFPGHVTIIVGYQWDANEESYIYKVYDPWDYDNNIETTYGQISYLTYEELQSYVSGEETYYWTPSVSVSG